MADNSISIILTAIDQLSGPMDKAGRALDTFGDKAQKIGANLEKLGTRVGGLGLAADRGLAQMGLDVKTVAEKSVEAEAALYALANTAGIAGDKAIQSVAAWTQATSDISRTTNQSQAAVVEALQALVSRGLDPKIALEMLPSIARAATATGASIQDMAKAGFSAFDNMKIPVSELKKTLDMMATAGNAGAFELKDMAQYFPQLTAASRTLGMEGTKGIASLSAALQIAMKGAGDTSTAANNLANFLAKLNSPDAVKKFEEMGVNINAEIKKGLESGDLIGYMGALIQRLTGGDAAKISSLFQDMQVKNFIAPMIQNLEEYKKIRDQTLGATGTIDAQYDTAMHSTMAKFDAFKNSAVASMQSNSTMQSILDGLKSLADWAGQHPDLAAFIGMTAAGAVVTGGAIVAIGAVVTAVGTLSTALSTLATFMAANPVVLTLLGVAAVGVASFAFGSWLAEQIDKAVQAVSGDKFATLGTKLYDLVQWFKDMPGKVKAAISGWITDFKAIGGQIMQGLINGIHAKYDAFIAKIKGLGTDSLKAIKDVLGIRSPSREFMEIGEQAGEGLRLGLLGQSDSVKDAAANLGGEAISGAAEALTQRERRNIQIGQEYSAGASITDLSRKYGLSEEWIKKLISKTSEADTMFNKLRATADRAWQSMEDGLVEFVKTGKLNWKSLESTILDGLARIAVEQAMSPLKSMFSNAMSSMFSFFTSANGNVFANAPALSAYSGQIVSRPTLFPFASGIGLMGEAGPEAILPLARGANGKLGVRGGGASVTVNLIESPGGQDAGTTRTRQGSGGETIIDVVVDRIRGTLSREIARGEGLAIPMEARYGLNPAGGAWR